LKRNANAFTKKKDILFVITELFSASQERESDIERKTIFGHGVRKTPSDT
jgi:hypothetical protein